jgi:hypothetical protein
MMTKEINRSSAENWCPLRTLSEQNESQLLRLVGRCVGKALEDWFGDRRFIRVLL